MIVCKNIIQPISAFYIFTKIYLFLSVYRGTTLGSFLLTKIVSDNSFIIFVNLKGVQKQGNQIKTHIPILFFCIEVDKIMECSMYDDRYTFSTNVIDPFKYSFLKVVCVLGLVFLFISYVNQLVKGEKLMLSSANIIVQAKSK